MTCSNLTRPQSESPQRPGVSMPNTAADILEPEEIQAFERLRRELYSYGLVVLVRPSLGRRGAMS